MLGMQILLRGIFLVPLLLALLVSPAYAVTCDPLTETPTDFGCLPTDPGQFTATIYGWGMGLLSFVAIIFMIIGGYFIMASRGDPERVQKGKSFIFYSIAGVLLAILGFVFIEIITGALEIPGFN
jgi:hypothetical protein